MLGIRVDQRPPSSALAKSTIAVILAIIIIGSVAGYLFYTNYVQGTVTLSIIDPPPGSSPYPSNVQHVYITFTKIEIHGANGASVGNESGWHTITASQTIDLVAALSVSQTVGSIKLSTGKYDMIRFFASTATITTAGINATSNIPSGSQTGVKVLITGGGFQVTPGTTVNLQLTLQFDTTNLRFPVVKADVV